MTTTVTIGTATLHLGDCRDVLPRLPRVDLVLTDTKNGQPRIVPMHPRVRCCAHIKQVEASATSRHFRNARAAVGMDWLHFHDLRHSAASAMINAGVDLYTVGGVLGHKSAISTKRYSHLITETMRAAIGRIGGQKLTHQGPVGKGKKTA